jgi:acyl carrier protein
MNRSDFFIKLKEYLEIESVNSINESTNLKKLEEYSSLTIMLLVAFIDEFFQKKVNSRQLVEVNTINDLMQLIGKSKFND